VVCEQDAARFGEDLGGRSQSCLWHFEAGVSERIDIRGTLSLCFGLRKAVNVAAHHVAITTIL
jgi:hypothetical protein